MKSEEKDLGMIIHEDGNEHALRNRNALTFPDLATCLIGQYP